MAASSLRALSQFYGFILAGAAGGLTTHDLWSAVQNAAVEQTGSPLSGVSVMDMNVLRGLAGSQLEAARQFAAASDVQGITSTMWANEIDQRPWAERQANPQYLVRFEHSFLDAEGNVGTEWRTTVWEDLPMTKGDLLDQLQDDAEGMSEKYSTQTTGVGNVMITIR
jgi:hypothetical protein